MSSTILDLITGIFESFLNKIWCHCDGWMTGPWMEQHWIISFISCAHFVHQPILTKIWYQVTYKNPAATAHITSHGAGEVSSFPESSAGAKAAVLKDSAGITYPRAFGCSVFVSLGKKRKEDCHLIGFNLPCEYPPKNNSTQGVFNYTFNAYKVCWNIPFLHIP